MLFWVIEKNHNCNWWNFKITRERNIDESWQLVLYKKTLFWFLWYNCNYLFIFWIKYNYILNIASNRYNKRHVSVLVYTFPNIYRYMKFYLGESVWWGTLSGTRVHRSIIIIIDSRMWNIVHYKFPSSVTNSTSDLISSSNLLHNNRARTFMPFQ